jgi:hypothetical protein
MLGADTLFMALAVLTGAGLNAGVECPVVIELESTQFASSAWVHPDLTSLGPEAVYLLHLSDGGLGYSVERVSELVGVGNLAPPELVTLQRKSLKAKSQRFLFSKPEVLPIHWLEVASAESPSAAKYQVPAGFYRFSILVSASSPIWSGKELQVWRVYSPTFALANSSMWGTSY